MRPQYRGGAWRQPKAKEINRQSSPGSAEGRRRSALRPGIDTWLQQCVACCNVVEVNHRPRDNIKDFLK